MGHAGPGFATTRMFHHVPGGFESGGEAVTDLDLADHGIESVANRDAVNRKLLEKF